MRCALGRAMGNEARPATDLLAAVNRRGAPGDLAARGHRGQEPMAESRSSHAASRATLGKAKGRERAV